MNGILNIYKEKGFTSFDVCAKLRGILKTRKIGHTGTLDPDAEGVLPVCVGNATKLCDMLTDKNKTYEAVLLLGVSTDTMDTTGQILKECKVSAGKEEVEQAIMSFAGTYLQIPPMYSAIKINGKKLYELARQGIEIERKGRPVTIHKLEILSMEYDSKNSFAVKEVRMRIHCSKGTYIRALCDDIGNKLACGGCMKELLRTQVSIFSIENSLRLSEVEEYMQKDKIEEICISVESLFEQYQEFCVKSEFDKLVYNGNQLLENNLILKEGESIHSLLEMVRIYDSSHTFIGVYDYDSSKGCLKPVKMFLN